MQPLADNAAALSRQSVLLLVAMTVVGFGLTLYVFYPGVMTFDALYVYQDIAKGFYGDWQSPAMTLLWSLIDPIAPGPASMFLLIAALYWLAFGLLALALARHSIWPGAALLVLAALPPAFLFVGTIWRDVLLADTWLLAAALVYFSATRPGTARMPMQLAAIALLVLGVLLRPNALIAAPLLGAYIIWPTQFLWRRAAILFAPMVIALYALVQLVYYGALHATRQHPLQTFMVFDLGGIGHFANENQFPVEWPPQQTAMITSTCYRPTEWDIYWRHEPCKFVMARLEQDKIFGTTKIIHAWKHAVAMHPIAYLQHRAAFMWNFLVRDNLTMWTQDVYGREKVVFEGRPAFTMLRSVDAALKNTPLLRPGTWLLLCIVICAFALRRHGTAASAFAIGVCGSAVAYVMTFSAVGVASDFRYAYWSVLAGIAGIAATVAARFRRA